MKVSNWKWFFDNDQYHIFSLVICTLIESRNNENKNDINIKIMSVYQSRHLPHSYIFISDWLVKHDGLKHVITLKTINKFYCKSLCGSESSLSFNES